MSAVNGRQQLASIRERKNTVRDRMAAAREAKRAAEAGNPQPGTPEHNVLTTASVAYDSAKYELDLIEGEERMILGMMVGEEGELSQQSFLRNPDTMQQLSQLASSSMPTGRVLLGPAVTRDELLSELATSRRLAANGSPTSDIDTDAGRTGPYYGVVQQLRRKLRLLDLIPSAPMTGKSFDYTVEWVGPTAIPGSGFETAAETPEGQIKPEAEHVLDDREAVAKTIAHWQKVRRQVLSDVPGLEAIVRDRLMYGVLRRVENQILAGDGFGENLTGILKTTGVGDVEYDAAELAADQALEGVVDVLLSEASPNAICLNPRDWADMVKAKATDGGDGHYFSGGPFVGTAQALWGCPVIPSTAVSAGTVLVGDFTLGCTLFIREGVNVLISRQRPATISQETA